MDKFRTIGEISKALGLSRATIRNWSGANGEFAEYLSPTARPEKGTIREFSPEDVKIFWFISQCRQQGLGYEAIHARLRQNEHQEQEISLDFTTSESVEKEATTAELRGQTQALEEERDWLRQELNHLRTELIAAERRAAEAETKLALSTRPRD